MGKPKCMHGLPKDYCDQCEHDERIAELEALVVWAARAQSAAYGGHLYGGHLFFRDAGGMLDSVEWDGTDADILRALRRAKGE